MALELFSRKATAVATNVPGPQMPLYLAGCEVREMMFWVPQNGTIGMGLSILSYNGRVHFGIDRRRASACPIRNRSCSASRAKSRS